MASDAQPAPPTADTTRYLCAASYLVRGFADRVVAELLEGGHRAVGLPCGVDAAPVVAHALRSRRIWAVRDVLLTVLAAAAVGLALVPQPAWIPALVVLALAAWAIVFGTAWLMRARVAASLLRRNFDVGALPIAPGRAASRRIEELRVARAGNVTVYSGFSPFVGSGFDVGGWSFALDLGRPRRELGVELTPRPFRLTDLYRSVGDGIAALRIEGLEIEDRLFVSGRDIRGDTRFLSDPMGPPRSSVDPAILGELIEHPSQTVRHYRCLRVVRWRGELVLSIFLRFARTGQRLFAEANYFLLPPLRDEYHELDELEEAPTFRRQVRLAGETLIAALPRCLAAPFVTLGRLSEPLGRAGRRRQAAREMRENPGFDYGAAPTVLDRAFSSAYRRYFQKLDKEMYVKVAEGQVLDAIIAFLDAHDVDTSDLRERQSTILNAGVIVSGGSVSAQNLAVGERASATTLLSGSGGAAAAHREAAAPAGSQA